MDQCQPRNKKVITHSEMTSYGEQLYNKLEKKRMKVLRQELNWIKKEQAYLTRKKLKLINLLQEHLSLNQLKLIKMT